MRPSSRLDVVVVDPDPDWIAALRRDGVLGPDGLPGDAAAELSPGGFRRWWLDQPGGVTLWANRQGGFTVRCPVTDDIVVSAFVAAWSTARGGEGPLPELSCPSCAGAHVLSALVFRPAAAFGKAALVLSEVAAPEVNVPDSHRGRVVLRRG